MFPQPKLTVCVPSRNRQRYFQETIRSLLANMRTDVQFVFADNSDDPAIMTRDARRFADRRKFATPAGNTDATAAPCHSSSTSIHSRPTAKRP